MDNIDGNITHLIQKIDPVNKDITGVYKITYNITDKAGNNTIEVIRTVNVVDTTASVITLIGGEYPQYTFGSQFSNFGATALDNYDNDLDIKIITVNDALGSSATIDATTQLGHIRLRTMCQIWRRTKQSK